MKNILLEDGIKNTFEYKKSIKYNYVQIDFKIFLKIYQNSKRKFKDFFYKLDALKII